MILQILLLSHYILGTSIYGADGINFKDTFNKWEQTHWQYDLQGFKHCGIENGNCFLTTRENLQYFVNIPKENQQSFETNELTISMRNDCEDEFCCQDDRHCTTYTSGQITSEKLYGYGSFHFNLRTGRQTEEYKVESTTFKSVKCTSNPKPEDFQYLLSQIPSRGYCVNNEADLENFSSNRDLCQGVGRNICSRSTWVINTLETGVFNFKAASLGWRCMPHYDFISGVDYEQRVFSVNVDTATLMETCKQICKSELNACVAFAFQKHHTQKICAFYETMGELRNTHHEEGEVCTYGTKAIDYDSAVIFVDGRIVRSGGRDLIQDFDVALSKVGRHKVQVYAYEDCCSGSSRHGYHGWTLSKKQKNKGSFLL